MDGQTTIEIIRILNALVWIPVVYRLLRGDRMNLLARRATGVVILIGMWVFVIGGATSFGMPADLARMTYTVFAAISLIIGAAILRFGGVD